MRSNRRPTRNRRERAAERYSRRYPNYLIGKRTNRRALDRVARYLGIPNRALKSHGLSMTGIWFDEF